ncbi:MAG: PaaI family thioesterase [Acidobacteria bacterium]|nr:PaaI family thioesterase [Acidobacteriota bacterium]
MHSPSSVDYNADMAELSLQEKYSPASICFGCGPANAKGLHIRSFAEGDEVVAEWHSKPEYQAFPGMLNGGIIGALLDCHSNWAAAYFLMKRDGLDYAPCTVTAEFHVKLIRPTPVDGPITLKARVVESSEDRATVEAELTAGGKICDTCRGVFVRVREGHPAYRRW